MPEGLTQTKTPTSKTPAGFKSEWPAGFISEWWPASNRNDGRLQVGIPGRNKSESALFESDGGYRNLFRFFCTINQQYCVP
ncbi:hypothetical protein ACVWZV_009293 [Bradyrhizobium sp. GM5.1]